MTNLNDKIKVIYGDQQLEENRIDISTTQEVVVLNITILNNSDVLLKNMKFTFPAGIDVVEPKILPERMIPNQDVELTLRIDTSITRTLTVEVEGGFLHVLAR